MKISSGPIVSRLTDTDFYKFTMGYLAFLLHRNVLVRYAFTNRTSSIRLAEHINIAELREQLDHVRTLRFGNSELHYLRGTNEYQDRMFGEDFLQFLTKLQLPEYLLEHDQGGGFRLEFSGPWPVAIYWETIALCIINELYYRSLLKQMSWFERDLIFATGQRELANKITILRKHPYITFSEFGTRRRFSREWQRYVTQVMAAELPQQIIGTSNTALAMDCDLLPIGTSAHEVDMVYSGIYHDSDEAILNSHNRALQDWWDRYGWGLSIALTDTYGSAFFFRDMSAQQARNWKGLRHDSGDPIIFGEAAIAFYRSHGIDPREKLLIFSDGLDVVTMIKIADHFAGRIKVTFGWGTNLTNHLGLGTLSLVIKAVESNGHGTVKLSDNLAKATGKPEDVERFKRVFGYTNTATQECVV